MIKFTTTQLPNGNYSGRLMTYENFIEKIQQPDKLNGEQVPVLKELVDQYPYFSIGRWLYLKALYNSNSIYYGNELKRTAVQASSRRNLYFFIHPEELKTDGKKERSGNSSGSYFDMLGVIENKGENNHNTLRLLAERLKAAREMLQPNNSEKETKTVIADSVNVEISPALSIEIKDQIPEKLSGKSPEELELEAKKHIKAKKYKEALEILKELNFNNPKKSIYFADQIRFLEKIIQNL